MKKLDAGIFIWGAWFAAIAYGLAFWIGLLENELTRHHKKEPKMPDNNLALVPNVAQDIYHRLLYPPYNLTRPARDAIIEMINEAPEDYNRVKDAGGHDTDIKYTSPLRTYLLGLIDEYEGKKIGGFANGR